MLQKKIIVQVVDEHWGLYSELKTVKTDHIFKSAKKAFKFARDQAEMIGKAGSKRHSRSKEIAQERLAWKRRKLILKGIE